MSSVVVNDIGFAAYLRVIKGFEYTMTPRKNAETRKFEFTFDVEQEEFEGIRVEYLNSKYRIFDLEIKELKRAINS